ncbi:MAG: CAP domain-containing protein [Chitinophagaceae bacterium]|nr:CAP domain-containing protein [Chitinophagaceae bacterium]
MLRRTSCLLICSTLFLFYSCQKGDVTGKTPPVTNPPANSPGTVNETTLLQLVNNVRQAGCACGSTVMPIVAAVTWNDQLETAALNHSNDMNSNNYFSHTGSSGSTAGQRITAAGYNWKAYGENIAKGYSSEQAVMDGWLNSEGHCKNIMSPLFKEMGVARVGAYWSQEFGSR